jgi:hypothetical protein
MELELKFSDARLSLRHLRHNFLVFQVACGIQVLESQAQEK